MVDLTCPHVYSQKRSKSNQSMKSLPSGPLKTLTRC